MAVAKVEGTDYLEGSLEAPPSKAYTHRALVAALHSEGTSEIENPCICEDTLATVDACEALGSQIRRFDGRLEVKGIRIPRTPEDVIHCRDSGSTMRFIAPTCALAPEISVLTGGESLRRRPMGPLLEALDGLGVKCYSTRGDGRPPIVIFGGGIDGGKVRIRGDVSSQFITGLLFSGPKASRDVEIAVTKPIYSRPYIEMTIEVLKEHGIDIDYSREEGKIKIPSGQDYKPYNHRIEGDYSSSSFILSAAALIPSKLEIKGLRAGSIQGDKAIIDILIEMGVPVKAKEDAVLIENRERDLKAIAFDARDTPDLVPPLMVLGSLSKGKTIIEKTGRLRWKESDRVRVLSSELEKMGGRFSIGEDKIVIEGVMSLKGAEVHSHNDHRIAMALTVAAMAAEGITTLHGVDCVRKSYPNFLEDLMSLGGRATVR